MRQSGFFSGSPTSGAARAQKREHARANFLQRLFAATPAPHGPSRQARRRIGLLVRKADDRARIQAQDLAYLKSLRSRR